MKKKYLQACEMGGSIYGKKRTSAVGYDPEEDIADTKEDFSRNYTRLYKKRLAAMDRVFNRNK